MPSLPTRLLVADDDPAVLEALRLLLKGEGYQVETATSPGGVLSAVETRDFDALLTEHVQSPGTIFAAAPGKKGLADHIRSKTERREPGARALQDLASPISSNRWAAMPSWRASSTQLRSRAVRP